jgi:hypothetical protein
MKKGIIFLTATFLMVGFCLSAHAIPKVFIYDVQISGKETTVGIPGREFPDDTVTVSAIIRNDGDVAGRVEKLTLIFGGVPYNSPQTAVVVSIPFDLGPASARTYRRDFFAPYHEDFPNPTYAATAILETSRGTSKTRDQLFPRVAPGSRGLTPAVRSITTTTR